MAELLAVGTTEADTAEFTIADGQRKTLMIKPASGTLAPEGSPYVLKQKTSGGAFVEHLTFTASDCPFNINGNGIFKVTRLLSLYSTGLDAS